MEYMSNVPTVVAPISPSQTQEIRRRFSSFRTHTNLVLHSPVLNERPRVSFTSCYDPTALQQDIFEKDVLPMIDIVYSGVVSNCIGYFLSRIG